jgi:hypothetical protein
MTVAPRLAQASRDLAIARTKIDDRVFVADINKRERIINITLAYRKVRCTNADTGDIAQDEIEKTTTTKSASTKSRDKKER